MLCIVFNLKRALLEGAEGEAGWVESTTWPQEPNIASFIHVIKENQEGKNTSREAVLGGIYWKWWMTMQLPVFTQ